MARGNVGETMDDLYAALGIPPDATIEQVRSAYLAAIRRAHPDVENGDEDAAKRLTSAYTVLSDGTRRADYDRNQRRAVGGDLPEGGSGDRAAGDGSAAPAEIDLDRPEPADAICDNCGPEPSVGFTVAVDGGHFAFRHGLSLNSDLCEECSTAARQDLEGRKLLQGPEAITGIFAALGYQMARRTTAAPGPEDRQVRPTGE